MSAVASVATAPLVINGLSLSFGGNHVLQDIALSLKPGEIGRAHV